MRGRDSSSVLYLRILATDLCAWNSKEHHFGRKCAAGLARAFGAGHRTRERKVSGRSDARHCELLLRHSRAISKKEVNEQNIEFDVAAPGALAVFARSMAAEGRRKAGAPKVSI